jgi:phospholipase/lecithinase/hemolysin
MHISPVRQRLAVGYVLQVLAAVLIATAGTAFAQSSPRVVTFGDSFSDSGNAFDFVKSNATPPGYGMGITLIPEAPYARNGHHLTNGPTWAELLADAAGAPQNAQPAFRSSNPRAMNFAIATARARGAAVTRVRTWRWKSPRSWSRPVVSLRRTRSTSLSSAPMT